MQPFRKRIRNPKRLFLFDSLGACLTVCTLLAVLIPLEKYIGMPASILRGLAAPASGLALYSACCFWFAGLRWRLLMAILSVANGVYCCVTAGLVIWRYGDLTGLGLAYFALEILVIGGLVWLERQAVIGPADRMY
ncbi:MULTISPECIES: hypothetical protein [Spirosoma]|uniref:Uncharacterized protein n=1 Tax=Spirosoma sordidisoli TaxID=2502893 RepID=A0A4Q2URZ5_9BACT|nr:MULTISPECIES: hypothetical protein [Spirosoma]RYC70505.1 hypothetical protein EQG79_11700 [Spirosoma sordidisoli]